MRKRICVFIGEISREYQRVISKYVTLRANSLGYDVVFICSYGSYNEDLVYAMGEKSCIHLPDCSTFDGIIVAEDVFDIDGMPDELYEVLKKTAKCPVVYLRTKREGFYSVLPENKGSIESMVRHLVEDHKFTDICFMSGKRELEDAKERLQAYYDVMKEHGLEVTEHMVFHGDYWYMKGKEAIDWFLEGRSYYPEAICCANDYMALSVCEELELRGIRVPEDVVVTGFDDVVEAREHDPSLTSVMADYERMAFRAVDIIKTVNSGEKTARVNYIPSLLQLRKSCGCGEQCSKEGVRELRRTLVAHQDGATNMLSYVTEYQDSFEFDEYMAVAEKYSRFLQTKKAYYCFVDSEEAGKDEVENDCSFTGNMVLRRIVEGHNRSEKAYCVFSRKELLPKQCWSETEPNNFFLFTLHFKNIVHGYVAVRMPESKWFDIYTQGYMVTLSNAIQNAEVHNKMEHLETIRAIYQNDALTGLFNRRGFDKQLLESYAEAKKTQGAIGVASIDMDNLKTINDTFGHSEGDQSLITLARALSSVMKEGDFCGRIGGDEFAAVIHIGYPGRCEEFKRELREALKRESKKNAKYFVAASVGIAESNEEGVSTLLSCIQLADQRMYEDKRIRKGSDVR